MFIMLKTLNGVCSSINLTLLAYLLGCVYWKNLIRINSHKDRSGVCIYEIIIVSDQKIAQDSSLVKIP